MDIVASGQITLTDLNDMTVSTTAPLNPYIGQLWWNVEEEQLYIYQNEEWIKSDKKILEQVDELGETIQTVSSALSSKVDNTTYKSFVQQTSTSLASKISAIDVENNYVKTSTFTQTVEGIQTTVKDKVSSSQFTQLAGVVESKMNTQDANAKFATQSQLTQTSSSLTSSITAVQNDLSNLSIGGRNYAVGTGNSKTFTGKGGTNETDTLYYVDFSKLAGKTITISFDYVTTTSGNNARFRVQQATSPYMSISEQNIYAKTELTHYMYTMNLSSTANDPKYLNIRMDDFTGNITISNLKLEIGSKATDWTPAPEDMVDFPTYNSYVQQTAESLSSKLSITDANNTFATQSQLTQTANSISTSVSNVQKNLDNLEIGGRNLITGTSSEYRSIVGSGWGDYADPLTNSDNISVISGKTYSARIYLKTSTQRAQLRIRLYSSDNSVYNDVNGEYIEAGSEGYSYVTFKVPANRTRAFIMSARFGASNTPSNTLQWKELKLEEGDKCTSWTPAPEDIDSKFSTVTQTIDGIQTTVSNKADKSTVTQLAGVVDSKISTIDANNKFATQSQLTQTSSSLTSSISNVQASIDNLEIGGRNFVRNGDFSDNFSNWSGWSDGSRSVVNITGIKDFSKAFKFVSTGENQGITQYYDGARPNQQYTVSFWSRADSGLGHLQIRITRSNGNDLYYTAGYAETSGTWYKRVFTFTTPSTLTSLQVRVGRGGGGENGTYYFTGIKLEEGSKATGYSPAPEDMATSSQISQLSTAINLRVEKDKIVNQINVSTEGILISGSKIRITGDTTIDNAVIKNAMIADLSASKLTAGTINASTITVTNLNASNITTGTLNTDRIASNTIQTRHIATNAVTANEIATGTITASSGIIASIDAGKITTGTLSADRIGAYTITANKLTLSDFTNLCENPDFETDEVGSTPKGFNSSGVARVADISGFTNGNGSARALEIDARSTGNNDIYASNYIPVTPNQRFYVEFEGRYLNNAGTGVGRIGFRRYDAKRNALSSWDAVATATRGNNDQQFSRYSGTYNVPANCYFLQIWISFSNNGESTNKFYFDNIRVHRMSTAELIVDGAITTDKIASRAITADKIVTGTITAGSGIIANLAIGTAQIQDSAITNAKIANLAVDTANIANGAITNAKIDSLAVNTANIVNGAITSAKIGNLQVNTAQIANGAITTAKIGNLQVDTANIKDGAITTAKIESLDAGKITTGTLSADRIGAGTINGVNISASTFVGDNMYIDGKIQVRQGRIEIKSKMPNDIGLYSYLDFDPAFDYIFHLYDGDIITGRRLLMNPSEIRLWATGGTTGDKLISLGKDGINVFGKSVYVNNTGYGTLLIESSPLIAGGIRTNGQDFYIGVDGTNNGEARVTNLAGYNSGNGISYRPIRAADFLGGGSSSSNTLFKSPSSAILESANNEVYARSKVELRVTKPDTWSDYIPVRASSFPTGSMAEYKQDIRPHTGSALAEINSATIYDYRLRTEVADGKDKTRIGLVIGEGYNTPSCVIDGDGVEQYMMNSLSWKAIQELSEENESLKTEIFALKRRIENLERGEATNG